MKYLKILGIVVVVVVVLIAGALIAVSFVDINQYKGLITEQVKQATGRDLSIDGNLELKVSLIPTVSVQGIRFANASWGSQPDMVTVGDAEVKVAVFPLLSGEIQLRKLVLKEPNILLETNQEGRGNWEFYAQMPDEMPEPEPQEEGSGLALTSKQLEIEKGRFIYRDGVSGTTTEINLDELFVKRKVAREQDWKLKLSYNGIPVSLEGTTGLIYDLLQNEPFMVQLATKVGDADIAVDGTVAQPMDAKGINLKTSVKTPNLNTFAKLADTELPPLGPIDMKAEIAEEGELYLVKLNGGAGDIKLDVDGKLAQSLDGKELNADFSVQTPDLKTVSKLADTELPAVGPIALQGNVSEAGDSYKTALNGSAGEISLELDGQLAKSLDGKGLNLAVSVKAPDLKTFASIAGTELPSVGPIAVTAKGSEAKGFYTVAVNGAAGKINLGVDGQIAQSLDGKGINLNLALQAPDLKMLGALGGAELPSVGPVDVKGRVSDIKGGIKVSSLNAKLGPSDLSGNASVGYEAKPMWVSAQLSSKLLDVSAFQQPEAAAGKEPAKQPAKKQPKKSDQRVFPADPLPFEQMKTANAEINFKAGEIRTRNEDLKNVQVNLRLKNGKLDIQPLQAVTTTGAIQGNVSLDASKAKPRLVLNLNIKDLELGKLKQLQGTVRGGKTSTSIKLTGTGKSVREIMASLNGETVVDVGKGQIVNKNLNLAGADLLSEIVEKINPLAKKSDTANLDCVVVRFDIKNGMATTNKGIAVQTDKMIVVGSGAIDLKNEQLDIGIRSDSRKRTGVGAGELTQVVRVRGTLANPKLGADVKGVATVGATVGAAVATAGVSYLAQKAYGAATKDTTPCLTALGKTAPKTAQKKDAKPDQASKESESSSGVKKWFGGAKKLFKD